MKKAIFLAISILAFACTKTSVEPSLKDSSVETDVINAQHPIGIFKVCLSTTVADNNPYYRVVLRYETNDIIPSGKLSYTTSDGVLVTSVYLPTYTRKAIIALMIGNNSKDGYIQLSHKGIIDTTIHVDGSNVCRF